MNWLQFSLWVGGIYAGYYLAMVLVDIFLKGKPAKPERWVNELTFSEIENPKKVLAAPEHQASANAPPPDGPPKTGPAIVGSGGVLIKELFNLARQESIVYTGRVSY